MISPEQPFFHPLRIIHAAILGGALLVLGVVRFAFLQPTDIDQAAFPDHFTLYLPIGVMVGGIALSEIIFKRMIQPAAAEDSLTKKLEGYRTACIVRWAILEVPILFSSIWLLMYHHRYFMGIALIGMAMLAFSRPIPLKAAQHLKLDEAEKKSVFNLK